MMARLKSASGMLLDGLDRLTPAQFTSLLAGIAILIQGACVAGAIFLKHLPEGWLGSPSYDMIARNLLEHGRYSILGTAPTGFRPPLYPLFLAGMIGIFGRDWITGTILTQAAILLGGSALLALSLQRLFRNRPAVLIGVVLFNTDLSMIRVSLVELETILFVTLLMGFFSLLIRARWSTASLASLSALAALAHLTRPTGLLLWPSLLLVLTSIWREGRGAGALARGALALALPLLVLAGPWQLFLYRELKIATILSSTAGGFNLFHGNNPDTLTMIPYVWVDDYAPWVKRAMDEGGVSPEDEAGTDRYLSAKALEFIRTNPGVFAKAAVVKLAALYSPYPTPLGYGDFVDVNGRLAIKNYHARSSVSTWLECLQMTVILMGAALFSIGAIRGRRRWEPVFVHIAMFVALSSAMQAVTVGATVYRLPLDPLLILLAAGFYADWIRRFRLPSLAP